MAILLFSRKSVYPVAVMDCEEGDIKAKKSVKFCDENKTLETFLQEMKQMFEEVPTR